MYTAPATISADALRFVRCEKSLDRAIAQHAMTLKQLPTRERHAIETGNSALADHARETVAAWAFRVAELGGTIEAKSACCAHCGAVVKAPKAKPARSEADVCRVKAWRRFMAIAKAAGLDCQARERMTIALAKYLGVVIPSRSLLSAGQICEAAAAVELGLITWA